jgi:hypothetical protein
MRWLSRLSNLVLLSAALAVAAAVLVLWPLPSDRADPLPVRGSEREVVWLNHATNVRDWERFVTAVRKARPEGVRFEADLSKAFPRETTEVPEVRLRFPGTTGSLLFRWYKITGEVGIGDWISAVARRRPPPLAVIGGNTSETALKLAGHLAALKDRPGAPLLLITQGTSYYDPTTGDPTKRVPLHTIYPGRMFRFCFTNRQMATAVTDFVWQRDNLIPPSDPLRRLRRFLEAGGALPPADDVLRPDADPAYLVIWRDDPYSGDLTNSFVTALKNQVLHASVQEWAWRGAAAGTGGVPIDLAAVRRGSFHMPQDNPYWPRTITLSVGSFNRPNRAEEQVGIELLDELAQHDQKHPLLVVPATSQPCRRFLRGLRKTAPVASRRFTVVTGDSIEFNRIYRDRNLTWPIQDLPLKLVFFCHRNPVDRDMGFRELDEVARYDPDDGSPTSGTEDLLLFTDVVETVVKAARTGDGLVRGADELAARLHRVRWKNRRVLFNAFGNRRGGTGEHVVYLRPPALKNGRVEPRSEIEVWARTTASEEDRSKGWVLVRYLKVNYDGAGGSADGGD